MRSDSSYGFLSSPSEYNWVRCSRVLRSHSNLKRSTLQFAPCFMSGPSSGMVPSVSASNSRDNCTTSTAPSPMYSRVFASHIFSSLGKGSVGRYASHAIAKARSKAGQFTPARTNPSRIRASNRSGSDLSCPCRSSSAIRGFIRSPILPDDGRWCIIYRHNAVLPWPPGPWNTSTVLSASPSPATIRSMVSIGPSRFTKISWAVFDICLRGPGMIFIPETGYN